MSHLKERKEKNCLNCGAAIYGRYCHICGQENIETKESFWHLIKHFIYDITHFDGKFFSTLKYLLFKPGYLTAEYIRGRRNSYLHPIKMYVFTSAIFFITFFLVFHTEDIVEEQAIQNGTINITILRNNLLSEKRVTEKSLTNQLLPAKSQTKLKKKLEEINNDLDSLAKDTTNLKQRLNYFKEDDGVFVDLGNYKTVKEYELAQSKLMPNKRHGFFLKNIYKKLALLNEKHKEQAGQKLIDSFLHKLPQLLFLSLPIFAAILHVLYLRRKKYYVEHGIFTVHLYIASFILMLIITISNNTLPSTIDNWVSNIILMLIPFYQYKAIRNYYQQNRFKTIIKLFILWLSMFIVIGLLFVGFFFISLFTI